jgi:sugar phosphate isomerase/epimerase
MRLGGPVFGTFDDPESWARAVVAAGYRAAYCPLKPDADDATVAAYARAAAQHDIIIAEVGAWSNPLNPDHATRAAAVEHCKASLHLADRIGARCCVNIAGSRGAKWDGPHPSDLTEETFYMIVATVRDIIDSVRPTRTYYTLETMPWMYPDSADSYLALVKAIDRERCAVHLDPVNLINSPQRYFDNAWLIGECFAKLGPMIKSCHAKDTILGQDLTVHLSETRPGTGGLDYAAFLAEVACLSPDTPVMLEHLSKEEASRLAAEYVRSVAARESISL